MYNNTSRVIEVDIDEILPNRFQPRIQFDEEEILELSDSIKEHGVIQPIVVRTIGDKYEIIAGERRYKASVLAGKETVPVIVKNLNDKDSAEIALIENVQRKNLTPIEEALSYKKILDMGYLTQENLANKLGKSQSSIANKIRLLNLSDEVQEALLENKISERHARSLLKLETSKLQNEMLNRIITERLTVRRTDEEIDKIKDINESSEEGTDDSQKIIEKGEIDMNNNLYGMPNIPENPQPATFDIFGNNNQQQVQTQSPIVEPQPTQNFDIFGGAPAQSIPVQQPTNIPTPVDVGAPVINDGNIFSQPIMPAPPVAPEMPSIQPISAPEVASVPPMGGIQFDANGTVLSEQPAPVSPEMPSIQPLSQQYEQLAPITELTIPQTEPIMESPISQISTPIQQPENAYNFGLDNTIVSPAVPVQSELQMPEPIIVTDFSKQYDPVMPQQIQELNSKVEFKEVINAIRECSSKIEKYGYKIDVEEYDLANLYQVVFKIEK